MKLMDKPERLPYGVKFKEDKYEYVKGECFFCEFNDDKKLDPVWRFPKDCEKCDPDKIYKVWYQYRDASDPADTDIHKNIYYIEENEDLDNIMEESKEFHDLINYIFCHNDRFDRTASLDNMIKAYKIAKNNN